jgi:hypothetical protein
VQRGERWRCVPLSTRRNRVMSWLQADRLPRSARANDMWLSFTLCRAGKAALTSFSAGVLPSGKACNCQTWVNVNRLLHSSMLCNQHGPPTLSVNSLTEAQPPCCFAGANKSESTQACSVADKAMCLKAQRQPASFSCRAYSVLNKRVRGLRVLCCARAALRIWPPSARGLLPIVRLLQVRCGSLHPGIGRSRLLLWQATPGVTLAAALGYVTSFACVARHAVGMKPHIEPCVWAEIFDHDLQRSLQSLALLLSMLGA